LRYLRDFEPRAAPRLNASVEIAVHSFEADARQTNLRFINLLCGHAIAAVNRGTDRFLYDSNQGMCRIDTATFPTEAIQNIGMGRYADNGARAYLVAANT